MNSAAKGFAVTLFTALAAGAQASLIGIDLNQPGLNAIQVPSSHDYANNPAHNPGLSVGQSGTNNATVVALTENPFRLNFTYLFKEAGFTNSFSFNGQTLFDTRSPSGGIHAITFKEGMGPLNFFFTAKGYTSSRTVTNGDNNGGAAKFATIWEPGSNQLYLGLDDHGGGPDGDYDDMVIKITAVPVTEPGTLALLGLGLAAVALHLGTRRRA
ncbi:MAG: PEP-CTERM sorting domain-containing protein [Oleiphilaceae bacterium]|nr:PEP-CTERM sorting domain-containing protein [Oleiphilaceae bacterium]